MSGDTIYRQDAIKALNTEIIKRRLLDDVNDGMLDEFDTEDILRKLPSAQQWIPFTTRPLTEEEKEEHPDWKDILDCELPANGQGIIVSAKCNGCEFIQMDAYYEDSDGSYLDSGLEIATEAIAWMSLPQSYKAESEHKE